MLRGFSAYCRRGSLLALAVLVSAALIWSAPAWSQTDTGPKGISVSGQGEVLATPDIARVSLGVMTQDKDAAKAAAENAGMARKIVEALTRAGVAMKDVQTLQYSVQPVYDYKQSPPKLTGYQVSNVVRATVRDLTKVGDIIDRSIAAGANNVQGVSFEVEKDELLRKEALTLAAKAALEKARVIAGALGVKLGRLTAATESVARPIYPVMYARAEAAPSPETPVLPGQVTVTANVSLVYDIAQ
ncbi:MAG: SIMPL domain-containing protein [Armatimonadota bacterium]|nr:SIMPL domain-containing protein [Armatimonadota bacterium]